MESIYNVLYNRLWQIHRHLIRSSQCGADVQDQSLETWISPNQTKPRESFTSLYRRDGEDNYVCLGCMAQFHSHGGVRSHLKFTVCGFGDQFVKPQKKSWKGLYQRLGDIFQCTACALHYTSQKGVTTHLKRTTCGFSQK